MRCASGGSDTDSQRTMEQRLACLLFLSITMCSVLALACGSYSAYDNSYDSYDNFLPAVLRDNYGYDFNITVQPPEIDELPVNTRQQVSINCSHALPQSANASTVNLTYVATIMSQDLKVAVPTGQQYGPPSNRTNELAIQVHTDQPNTFTVNAVHVGRVTLVIKVSKEEEGFQKKEFPATVSIIEYRVSVIRRIRTADLVFDAVIAAIAMLNVFSVGCCTDWPSLKAHLRHPSTLIIGVCCQFIIMPVLALAIAKILALDSDLALGLFYVACVPGGGTGHIMVSVVNGDRALSISINFVSTFMSIGTTPLWIFAMGRFLASTHTMFPLADFEMWLVVTAGSYSLGIFLRRVSSATAEAFLNWLAKPLGLLFTLLYVTIGIYINIYMFTLLSTVVMIVVGLLPIFGFLTGGFISYMSRQDTEFVKTIATETTLSNCLLVLIMIRYSLPQPDADIASTIPMWVMFMSPVPFILAWFMHKFRKCVRKQCAKRREKKYRHFSIVSSLLNVTNVTTLSTSVTPKVGSPTDHCHMFIDEKVTVL